MRWVSAMTSGPSWSASGAALERPTPCSPVIVPPSRIARCMTSGRPGRTGFRLLVAAGVDDDRVGVAVTGVGHDGISTSLAAAISAMPVNRSGRSGIGTPTSSSMRSRAARWRGRPRGGLPRRALPRRVLRDVKHSRRPPPRRPLSISAISSPRGRTGCVGLGEEQGAGVAVEPHRLVVLDGVDRGVVHELHHRGPHVPPIATTTRPRRHRREGGDEGGGRRLRRHEAEVARVTTPSVPSLPTKSLTSEARRRP